MSSTRWTIRAGVGLLLAAVAMPAWANGATPFLASMFATLLLLNAAIGLVEGALLKLMFRGVSWAWAIGLMVAANYFSMLAGRGLSVEGMQRLGEVWLGLDALRVGPRLLAASVALLFVLTIVLEYPFLSGSSFAD